VSGPRLTTLLCVGPTCGDKRGSAALVAEMRRLVALRGLGAAVEVATYSCFGQCRKGPNVVVRPFQPQASRLLAAIPTVGVGVTLYNRVTLAEVGRIVDEHLVRGERVRDLMNRMPLDDEVDRE
jgi:(2Fe-2S) ferredoxin